ncbi:Threonine/homoserine efflux transporter RhtA [Amycolatopsis arida]|uniref:Threonine/homoserine efflux transporter RhtA n=1 Tax=Amycolatopsis arida TaxID=587909 RepID=A0A1I5VFN1_9PSEU|nr:EamA family transporter [Amycolatopsis arida]TDX91266.1 threonine/homoserine efflux transporter RhtA [Amycolatopsis arida]SFQ06283.1 Threonine/homoserine efflux transporter RhtA [Amycolatopsis arida]
MTTDVSAPPRPFSPSQARGLLLILLASVCFGSSGAIGKPAMLAGLAPEQVAAARIALSAVVLALGVGLVRPALLRVRRGEWRLLAGYGLLGVAGVQLLYFVAVSRVPVGVAILLEFTSPVLVALWVRFVRRVRLPRVMWAGIGLAMLGLAMVAQVHQGLRLDGLGLLAGLGAALCSAAYFLLGEHGVASRHPLGMVTWGMIIGAVAVCAVAPPWTWPTEVLAAPAAFGPWRPPVWLLLVAVALVSTVLAYLAGITALRHLPASVASVLALGEPLVATGLAWATLGEALTWPQLLGAAVLLGGATVVQLTSPGKRPPTPAEPLPEPTVRPE